MHIIELQVENYKRLRAVRVTPEGRIIDIVGRNGQGKSSLLDSIYAVLAGASALPTKPIRKGANKATIVVKIGDKDVAFVIKRHFTSRDDGSYLSSVSVENGEGAMYRSPQTMLDGLLDAISFDPLSFARMPAKDQLLELRRLVPGIDFDDIDAKNRGDYQKRQDVNRRAKESAAELNALRIPGDPNAKPIDEAALVAELEDAGKVAADIEKERARRHELARAIRLDALRAEDIRAEIVEQEGEVERLEKRVAEIKASILIDNDRAKLHDANAERLQVEYEALPPLAIAPDTLDIRTRIVAARKANADLTERTRALERAEELRKKVTAAEDEAEALTTTMRERTGAMVKAIADAQLPVEGLTFTVEGVFLNGLPFEQASDAEKLRTSVAVIAARRPKLRVVRIHEGSLLDPEGTKALGELAEKYDLQVWREVVQDGHKTGIIIEDGEIAAPAAA